MTLRIGQARDHGFDEPLGLLSDCHRRIEHFLRVLGQVAEAASGGPLTAPQRADAEAAVRYFATAAPTHTADEEESVFPRLRASTDPAAASALVLVDRLQHDHDVANERHRAVETLMRRWLDRNVLEPDRLTELRQQLAALRAIYESHIAVEDRELFPAAARLFSAGELSDIGREMEARRLRRS
jgi:hemerythrin-like domain-containing protein